MNVSPRKALNVSITAFVLSLVFFIFTLIFGAIASILGVYLLAWQTLAGLLIWGVLIVQFYQRHLAEQERLDMDRLKQSDQGTIFSDGGGRMAMLEVAQKRLVFYENWIIPIASVLISLYEVIIGLLMLKRNVTIAGSWEDPQYFLLSTVLMAALSFVSFLFSKYTTGLSVETKWKPLRAGGSYMLATAVLGFALAACSALAQYKHPGGLAVLSYVIPVLMILLGAEMFVNVILDIYRPRVAGQYNRAAFDSRILGLFSEPGGILHTVAHTMDYQFGFKVSQTWFYQLFEKAVIPLVLFAVLVLYLMSCFVVVEPGEAGVVEFYGNPTRDLASGLHLKWPWPIEKVHVYPTEEIQQISIGYEAGEADSDKKLLLWGEKHYEEEYNLLVAVRVDSEAGDEGVPPVGIVQANVPIQYRISNIRDYIYNHKDSQQLLESICYRELTRFAASASLETENGNMPQKSLLGAGRMEAGLELQKRIQAAADSVELGVEIVMVGLQGVHPPPEVAKEYEALIASIQEKQASVLAALAKKNIILTELAGSIEDVDELYQIAMNYEQSKDSGDANTTESLRQQMQAAFSNVKGNVFKTLREAESYAAERVNLARGEGLRFAGQVKAYRAAPDLYQKIQRLETLEEGLKDVRKYIIVAGDDDSQVYTIDLQQKLQTSAYDLDFGLDE